MTRRLQTVSVAGSMRGISVVCNDIDRGLRFSEMLVSVLRYLVKIRIPKSELDDRRSDGGSDGGSGGGI